MNVCHCGERLLNYDADNWRCANGHLTPRDLLSQTTTAGSRKLPFVRDVALAALVVDAAARYAL